MNDRPMRLLVLESDAGDMLLVAEAAAEIAEARYARPWLRPCELVAAGTLREGLQLLREEAFDCMLMDLALAGAGGVHGFLRLRAQAPETPLVLLVNPNEEALALNLVRQGAQDFLVKTELDALPLARSLACSVDRNRLLLSRRSLELLDGLTGLYNLSGLQQHGARCQALAGRLGLGLMILSVELAGLEGMESGNGAQSRDLALIMAAELLRGVCRESDILARPAPARLVMLALLADSAEQSALLEALRQAKRSFEERWEGPPVHFVAGAAMAPRGDADSFAAMLDAPLPPLCDPLCLPLCENVSVCANKRAIGNSCGR